MRRSDFRKLTSYAPSEDSSKLVKIGQASQLLQVSIDTLRRWEKKGLLKGVKTPGGTRLYDKEQLLKLSTTLKKAPNVSTVAPVKTVTTAVKPVAQPVKVVTPVAAADSIIPAYTAQPSFEVSTPKITLETDRPILRTIQSLAPEVNHSGINNTELNIVKQNILKGSINHFQNFKANIFAGGLTAVIITMLIVPGLIAINYTKNNQSASVLSDKYNSNPLLASAEVMRNLAGVFSPTLSHRLFGTYQAGSPPEYLAEKNKQTASQLASGRVSGDLLGVSYPSLGGQVLAESSPSGSFLQLNIDTEINGNLSVDGEGFFTQNVTAPNLLYTLTAGENIEITGDPQNPIISALALATTDTLQLVTERGATTNIASVFSGGLTTSSLNLTGSLNMGQLASDPSSGINGATYYNTGSNKFRCYISGSWANCDTDTDTVGGSGTITGVTAGNGLSGGGTSGSVSLALDVITTSTTTTTTSTSGLEVTTEGLSLLRGCSNDQILRWNAGTGSWDCGMGAGSAVVRIEEADGSSFTNSNIDALDFAGGDFDISIDGASEVNIQLAPTLTTVLGVAGSFDAATSLTAGTGNAFTVSSAGLISAPSATLTPTSAVALTINQYGTAAGETGEVRFMEGGASSTQYIGFKAPDSLTTNAVYTLPNHDATAPSSDYVLTWQTGNVLEWKTVGGVGGVGDITAVGNVISGVAFTGTNGDGNTGNNLYFEGTTVDNNEINIAGADAGFDETITLPALSGSFAIIQPTSNGTATAQLASSATGSLIHLNETGAATPNLLELEVGGTDTFVIGNSGATTITTSAGTDLVNVLTGNLKIGNGSPTQTLNGEDAYIEGTLEIDGILYAGSASEALTVATGKIDADAIALTSATDGLSGTSSGSGLATYSDTLSLLQGCGNGQVLKWTESTDTWDCANDTGAVSSVVAVQEGGTPIGTNIDTLNFSGTGNTDIAVTDAGTVATIDIDYTTFGTRLTTFNIGDGSGTRTLDIGGVTSDSAHTINIATNATSADIIDIGNNNSSTTLTLTGGDDWSISAGGAATFGGALVGNGSFTLGDNGDTGSINTSDWDISTTGAITNATYEGLTIGSTTGTFNLTNGKTFAVSNSLTFAGTDSTTITFQGTDTYVGRTTTDTLTNKTLTAPRFADNGFLADSNGNEILVLDSAASAINQLTITNSATGNGLTIASTGDDTDVALSLDAKGAGVINIGNTSTGNLVFGGGSASTGCTLTNSTGAFACTAAITASNISGSTSGTNTGDQNVFTTLVVSGQSNVVTDATSDTLTLVAGSGATITTDASTDTITISATGTGGTITAIGNVTTGSAFTGSDSSANKGNSLVFEGDGSTDDANDLTLTSAVISGSSKTITLPNLTGTVALLEGTQTFTGAKTFDDITIADTSVAFTGGSTTFTTAGTFALNPGGAVTLGDGGDTLAINSSDWDISTTGAITNATYEGLTITANGTNTLNIAAGKTLAVNNTLTFAGTDSTTITFQGTDTYVGRATTDTLTNKTLTAPRFADNGFLADSNGNEILVLDSAASAINQLTITNSATGNGLTIASTGDDTDVALSLDAKGAGVINIGNTSTGNLVFGGGSASTGCTLTNSTGAFACTAAITASNIAGSTSGTNTGDQNVFTTIAVSGESNVVTDTASDTLTLVAGTGATITTNAGTDTITISATGTGGTITAVGNVLTGSSFTGSDSSANKGNSLVFEGDPSTDDANDLTLTSAAISGSSKTITLPNITGTVTLLEGTQTFSGAKTFSDLTISDTDVNFSGASTTFTTTGTLTLNPGGAVTLGDGGDTLAINSSDWDISTTGAITNATYEGLTITANGTNTLNIAAGKTLTTSNTLTFAGTDSTTITFQGTDTYVGRTTTDTLTNKTLTAPRFADNGFLADANGNEILALDSNASAVNQLTISNSATGNGLTIASTGDDTDIALSIDAKGAGVINLGNSSTGNLVFGGGSGSTGCTLTNSTGAFACTAAITASNISGSTSGTNTGDQNVFTTLVVSGQSNVVTDATSDTLTLVAGSGTTITTDASTDTITISATGSGGDITAVGDVTANDAFTNLTGATSNGNSLYFEGTTADGFDIQLTAADPGADFAITLPALTGTVALLEGTQTFTGAKTFDDLTVADTNINFSGVTTTFTTNGAFTLTPGGAVTLGDGGDTMAIDSSDWDISATGALTGITGITNDSSYTQTGTSANAFTGATTFSRVNSAAGSADAVTLSGTLGAFDGSDTFRGLYLNYTNANHTGTTNVFNGIELAGITGDAEATENALNIGNGWDNEILFEKGSNDVQFRVTAPTGATRTLTVPALTADRTIAVSASTPVVLDTVTGEISCPTCAIVGGAGGSKWTSGASATYLTDTAADVAVGGTDETASPFGVNVSAQSLYVGSGSSASGNIIFKASDGDTGIFAYNTSDQFTFTGGTIAITPVSAGALTLNQFGTSAGETAEVRFMEGGATSTQYVAFKAPDSLSTNAVYTLPNHDSSAPSGDYVLTWQTGNTLEWKAAGGVSGAGDITAVGDVTTGLAFTETGNQGSILYFEGATSDTNEILLTSGDPGADFTVTLPSITGTLASLAGTQTFTGAKTFDDIVIADTNVSLSGASTTLTSTGAFTLTPGGAVTLGDGGDTMAINTSDWDISATGGITNATYEGLTITSTTGTFTLAAGKTLTTNNTLTFAGTDATTITFQGTDTYVGRTTTDTLTNKTLTAPRFADGGFLADSNGNEILVLDSNASAVNQLTIDNSSTGNGLTLAATGDDTDVSLSIDAKGAGVINIGNTSTGNLVFGGGSGSTGCTLTNSTGAFACTGSVTASNISGSTSGTNTGDQNIFTTIAVSGESNIVSDATSDTLTLVAGTGVTITNNAGTDAITISATGTGGDITAVGDITTGDAFTNLTGGTSNGNQLYFEGSTADGFDTLLTAADPGADFTITLPAITGTVALLEGTQTFTGAKTFDDITIADTNISLSGASTTLTSTGAFTLTPGGAVTLGDGGDTMAINTSDWDISTTGAITNATYEGLIITSTTGTFTLAAGKTATINNTLTFAGTDGETWTFPDATGGTSGTVAGINQTQTFSEANTFSKVNTAGGSANSVTLSGTLGAFDGTDTFRGLYLNYTNADHAGATNIFNGLDIASITGDAQATETAVNIGSGWDSAFSVGGTTVINGSGQVVAGQITGTLFTLAATTGSNSTIAQGSTVTIAAGTDITTTNNASGQVTIADSSTLATVTGRGASTTTLVDLNGGIAVDTSNFTVSGTTGAVVTASTITAITDETINGLDINAGSISDVAGYSQLAGNFVYTNASGDFGIDSDAFDVTNAGAVSGITTLSLSGAISDTDSAVSVNDALDVVGDFSVATNKFTVASATGATVIAGSADGTDALTLTLGDILVSNGDLDLSGGDFNVVLDAADEVDISKTAAAAATEEGIDLTFTTGAGDGSDVYSGFRIAATSANHSASSDKLYGINIANLASADAEGAESAIFVGTGWDDILNYNGTTIINGTGQIVSTGITGTLFTITDGTTPQTIEQGNTITYADGTDINVVTSATDTVTVNNTSTLATVTGRGASTTTLVDLNGGIAVDTNNFTVSGTTGATGIVGAITTGTSLSVSFDSATQTGALTGALIDFGNITSDATNTVYGLRVADLGTASASTEYGIYQSGTDWDYGLYVEDAALFNTTLAVNGTTIGLDLDADADNLIGTSATAGGAASNLYWGNDLLCDATAANCGWATSSSSPWQTSTGVVNLVTGGDTVTIGSTTALGKLAVDGDADEIQLLIQGNGTQTSNLVVFETSGGTDLFSLTNAGNATIAGNLTVSGTSLLATSATTITLGSTGADTIILGNAGADTITIGDTASTGVSITDNNWNITAAGAANFVSIGATTPGTGAFTTLSSTGVTTLGNNSSTVTIDTTSWDVSAAGAISGLTGFTQGSGAFSTTLTTTNAAQFASSTANSDTLRLLPQSGTATNTFNGIITSVDLTASDKTWSFPNASGTVAVSASTPIALNATTGDISCATCLTSSGGGTFALTLSSDTGSDETLNAGNTIEIAGGTNGIDTVTSATDTVTLNLDTTEIGAATFGSGAAASYTWTFDNSGTDTTMVWGSGLATYSGDLTISGGDLTGANGESLDIGEAANGTISLNIDGTSGLNVGSTGISSIGNVAHSIVNSAGALAIDSATTGAINIGTSANAKTITLGNATGATALAFNSGTGSQTFTSQVVSGTTTTSAFVFDATALTTGTGSYLTSDSITTGKLSQIATTGNTLTSGTLSDIRTTSTALTGAAGTGSLMNLDWTPGSATTATGDLFALNIGANGTTTGKLFNILDSASSLFSVSEVAFETSLPANFTSPGDVSIANDLQFTNPTASFIKSYSALTLQAGDPFGSSNLTLSTYNEGSIYIPSAAATANAVEISAPNLTTGSALAVNVTEGTLAGGYYFRASDTTGGTDVFTIAEDGVTTIAANTATTTGLIITDTDFTNALSLGDNNIIGTTGAITYTGATTWSSTGGNVTVHANSNTANLFLSGGDTLPSSVADGNDVEIRAEDDIFLNPTDDVRLYANGAAVSCAGNANGGKLTTDASGIIACADDANAGAAVTLQDAYNNGTSPATISLLAADDGIVFTNPTSLGTDGAYLLFLNQAHTTGAVSALDITQASNNADAVNLIANALDTENILDISGTALTTGAAINIALTETALNGGFYLKAYDNTATATVFSVGEDGATTITGLEGSNMLTVTAGDAVISDGSLTLTDDDNATSFALTNNTATTADVMTISGTGITSGSALTITGNSSTGISSGASDGFVNITADVGSAGTQGNLVYLAPDFSATTTTVSKGLFVNGTDSVSSATGNGNYGIHSLITTSAAHASATKVNYGIFGEIANSSTNSDTSVGVYGKNTISGALSEASGLRLGYGMIGDLDVSGATTGVGSIAVYSGGTFTSHSTGNHTNGTTVIYGATAAAGVSGSASMAGSVLVVNSLVAGGDDEVVQLHTGGILSYAGLFLDNPSMNTTGTTTKYGINIENFAVNPADYNYGICFDCDGTYTTSSSVNGITWGTDANTVTLYRSASDTLRTDDAFNVNGNFNVSSAGAISAATGITSSGTINFSGLSVSSAVYTDGSKNLTSTAPTSGAIGYWSRTGTTLTTATAADNVTVDGTFTTNGVMTLGDGGDNFALNSNVLDISTAGAITNATGVTMTSGNFSSSGDFNINRSGGANIAFSTSAAGNGIGFNSAVVSTGQVNYKFTPAAHINMTTEKQSLLAAGATYTITGGYATQRFNEFDQFTITAGSALNISSEATTMSIGGAPISAGSATIANAYALKIDSGTSVAAGVTNAYGLSVSAPTGATNNYAATFATGNVGIGDTSPTSLLTVGASDAFQINSSGNIVNLGGAAHSIANSSGALAIDSATTGAINIGTSANAKTITLGNATGATALAFNSGTGSQTFTSLVDSGTTTTSAFVFDAAEIKAGTGAYFTADELTTGKLAQFATTGNTLTTGTLVDVRSTATSLTGTAGIGSLANLDWSPGSTTTATGDLFSLNIGANGTTTGNLFNILDSGSSIFSISETAMTTSLPANFTAPGDVAIAYDINFTNPTASYIKSAAPLVFAAGETFNSSNLTLQTYNQGTIVFDTANTTTTSIDASNSTLTTGTLLNLALSNTAYTGVAGTGSAINVAQSGVTTGFVGNLVGITGTSTTGAGNLLGITAVNTTAGSAVNIASNALTTGTGLLISHTTSAITSGSLLRVTSTATDLLATNGLVQISATGAFTSTSNVGLLNISSSNGSQVSGTALNVVQTGTTTGYTGNFVNITGSSTTGAGNLVLITGANTSAGSALKVVSNSLTAGGSAITVNNTNATTGGFGINMDSGTTTGATYINFTDGPTVQGSITNAAGAAVLYNTTSDIRTKENITDTSKGLNDLMKIQIKDFSFISDANHSLSTGFIAQNLVNVFKDAVSTNGDNGTDPLAPGTSPWSVDYGRITPLIVKSVQDLNYKVENALLTINPDGLANGITASKITVNGDINISGVATASNFSIDATQINRSGTLATIPVNSQNKISLADVVNQLNNQTTTNTGKIFGIESQQASQSAQLAEARILGEQAITHAETLDEKVASTSANISSLSSRIDELLASLGGDSNESTNSSNLPNLPYNPNLPSLTPPSELLATGSATLANINITEKTSTMNLEALDATVSATFKSLGETFLGNTTIAGDLSVDGTMSFTNGNSINAFPVLYIQNNPLAQAVDFFNGLVTISKAGVLEAKVIVTDQIKVNAGTSAGTVIIPAGQTEIPVLNDLVEDDSIIILTSETAGAPNLAVSAKVAGSGFIVSLNTTYLEDVKFSYLIVGTEEAQN